MSKIFQTCQNFAKSDNKTKFKAWTHVLFSQKGMENVIFDERKQKQTKRILVFIKICSFISIYLINLRQKWTWQKMPWEI